MPRTDPTTALWRRPQLAPVYAAVVAFAAVAVASLVMNPPATPAPGDQQVCVRSSDPVRVAGSDPASPCTAAAAGPMIELTLQPVLVLVEADGDQAAPPSGATVTIRDPDGRVQQSGVVDPGGRFDPWLLPEGGQVCLDPPAGWAAAEPAATEPGGIPCQRVTNAAADVVFRLEPS